MAEQFDAIIIGSGQAGNPLAIKLAKDGMKTALIERKHVGGSCTNFGCTPTKTMIASAETMDRVNNAAEHGILIDNAVLDYSRFKARKDQIVQKFREGEEQKIQRAENLELIYGTGRFADEKTVEVLGEHGRKRLIRADLIFIDTGTRTIVPPIKGIEDVNYLTSSSLMDLNELPEDLIVLGGGYTGLEVAQMYKRLGSEVFVLESGDRLVKNEDKDVSEEIERILREDGITVHTSSEAFEASQEGRRIMLRFHHNGKTGTLDGSHLFIATGRKPNTEDLNLKGAGIKADDKGYIKTNEWLETNIKGIYAMGDVKGGPAFTHVSYDDFRIIYTNLNTERSRSIKDRLTVYTMYTDPQLARVGLNEKEAAKKEWNPEVVKIPMENVARAIETGKTRGFMKALINSDNGKIAGATVLASEGGELIATLQLAIQCGVSYDVLRDAMFSHPSYAEALNNLFQKVKVSAPQ